MKDWTKNLKLDGDELVTFFNSNFYNTDIYIRLMGTNDKVHEKQSNLINEIISNNLDWQSKSVSAIVEYYKKSYEDYRIGWQMGGADEETIDKFLPKDINSKKLLTLITPSEIYIKPEENCEEGTFGFGLECEWDEEHGLGVFFRDWVVFEVGGMDVSFSF